MTRKLFKNFSQLALAATCCGAVLLSCAKSDAAQGDSPTPGNPYLPLWEHIPDGEPYVFEDPDQPGRQRVYIYGSHDSMRSGYCGREQVVWSASVDSLTQWRYDGEIFSVSRNAQGDLLDQEGKADVLYAPDVTLVTAPDGRKTYYLYPNNQAGGRNGMVCKSSRPDGPFEVVNWSSDNPNETNGVLGFDPAVFVDDDGRVYGYWGFGHSCAAELDPATMATVKPGTQVVEDMVSGFEQEGEFRFFEASSIRKVKDKYIFIYSRFTKEGEFGLPMSNYTLAYAYGDHPLGPFTYGGTIIDGRARDTDEQGNVIATATVAGNTHGSICEIGGQWYVFYHRQTGLNEFARQAMVAPIEVSVEEGAGGQVRISEGEYTSEGFSTEGLNPLQRHSAGIACWYTGPKVAIHNWPDNTFFGSYVAAGYGPADSNPVVNNTDGSIVGYKYFNFSKTQGRDLTLWISLVPEGIDGTIRILADSPWESKGGVPLGELQLRADMPQDTTTLTVALPALKELSGKHALFFTFASETKEKSLCTLHDFGFTE